MTRPRILVTNDDGIDSVGLHVLARAVAPLGDVVVAAPDQEFSGAGAAIGALHVMQPEVHQATIDGIDAAWAVTGPPALCVMFARLGAFGPIPDLIVSGINPGANVGRSVYHSGTVGAAITGRNGQIPGIAVSQSVSNFGVEGQAYDEMLAGQRWESAATIGAKMVEAMLSDPPPDAGVMNLNVPNLPVEEIKGWRWTSVGEGPPRSMAKAIMEPKLGHEGSFKVKLSWGDEQRPPAETDTGTVMDDRISVTWLSRITALHPETPSIDAALNELAIHDPII
ncbi:MAG: 5'/3'-nucleotidase SurE [Actinomycetia bacterium]|nr:5'/3'-nucleotidase SurE [Actinomycetes bacterium]MCP5034847.1 5'/3'-nucleotidase SurE [Actinomycetes bacterium]